MKIIINKNNIKFAYDRLIISVRAMSIAQIGNYVGDMWGVVSSYKYTNFQNPTEPPLTAVNEFNRFWYVFNMHIDICSSLSLRELRSSKSYDRNQKTK